MKGWHYIGDDLDSQDDWISIQIAQALHLILTYVVLEPTPTKTSVRRLFRQQHLGQ